MRWPPICLSCPTLWGALFLGLVVGYERSYRGRAAGMRTYGLVCMSSCALIVITGHPQLWYGGHTPVIINAVDPGRVIQGVCTGIGFLGAGVIMRDGLNISGLTTAASIWSVSAIGVLVGVGFYGAAIAVTILSAIFMMWGMKIENLLPSRHALLVTIVFEDNHEPALSELEHMSAKLGYEVARGSFSISKTGGRREWRFVVVSRGKHNSSSMLDFGGYIDDMPSVHNYQLSHARN